jgi:hypothetical protein
MRQGLLLGAILLSMSAPVQAVTRHVPGDYATIQAAVDAALPGDLVLVAPGVYGDVTHVAGGGDTTRCAVVMKSDITLRGSGIGVTTIDCDSLGRGIHCDGVVNANIEKLSIENAFAENYGAGIFCRDGSSPQIRFCELTRNWDGGLICLYGSSPIVTDCLITDNVSKEGGGLAAQTHCDPQLLRCVIAGNSAPSGGGVVMRDSCDVLIEDCVVSDNSVNALGGFGGGILALNAGTRLTIRNSEIERNVARGAGGGVAVGDYATAELTDTVIHDNSTTDSFGPGGGLYCDFSSATLARCRITRNHVTGSVSNGGGIYMVFAQAPASLYQCTIAANSITGGSVHGGGIYLRSSSPQIEKSIIAFNGPGEGMYCATAATPSVSCTDLYGNTGGNTLCGVDAGNNFSLDPLFCDLAADDYRIDEDSPCAPGNHPNGPGACDGDRIGCEPVGCEPISVGDVSSPIRGIRLLGSRPNPFGATTALMFEIARPGRVCIQIFDVAGRQVRLLAADDLPEGRHEFAWDGTTDAGARTPNGVYFYRVSLQGAGETGRVVVAR